MRTDVGQGIGYGHLIRTLSLADQLIQRGAEVTVAMRAPSDSDLTRVRGTGAKVRLMPSLRTEGGAHGSVLPDVLQHLDAQDALGDQIAVWDAIVVDHYALDVEWETAVRGRTRKLVVIDDLANRQHRADVLIDHNWYGPDTETRYSNLLNGDALQLLGPRYCLLNIAYSELRKTRPPVRQPPRTVLINFGGTDVASQTLVAATSALDATQMDVEIAIGSSALLNDDLVSLARAEPRISLNIAVPNMAQILGRVDLVVGASGTGTWERFCMRVPSIVTTVSESQSGVTRALAKAGVCTWLGVASEVVAEDYTEALMNATARNAPVPPPVVDGHGSARIAMVILDAHQENIVARQAQMSDDASFVSCLAGLSPSSGPQDWYNAETEFQQYLASDSVFEVLLMGGAPVGAQIRLQSGEVRRFIDRFVDERDISCIR